MLYSIYLHICVYYFVLAMHEVVSCPAGNLYGGLGMRLCMRGILATLYNMSAIGLSFCRIKQLRAWEIESLSRYYYTTLRSCNSNAMRAHNFKFSAQYGLGLLFQLTKLQIDCLVRKFFVTRLWEGSFSIYQ